MSYLLLLETSGNQAYIYATNKKSLHLFRNVWVTKEDWQWVDQERHSHGRRCL